jgi:transcriptional regulator with XRE-family HTH domain
MKKTIYSEQQECLIKLLRQIRIENNFTQLELAKKLNQPQSFISKYESGERRVDLVELKFICNGLGISLMDFIERFEKNTNESKQ